MGKPRKKAPASKASKPRKGKARAKAPVPPPSLENGMAELLSPEKCVEVLAYKPPKDSTFFSIEQMLEDVAFLQTLSGKQIRDLLGRQLDLSALQGNQATLNLLKIINDNATDEITREVAIGRLAKFAFFNNAVVQQRSSLTKAEFIDEPNAVEKDPADLTHEEWQKRFMPRLQLAENVS